MDSLFQGLFDTSASSGNAAGSAVGAAEFLACIAAALIIGIIIAFVYSFRSRYTQSFVLTLVVLPAIVAVVIMMVNGNIGAGVAVAGAFSLVRFRSAPGSARDIGTIFMAMGAGLVCGMGYLAYAFLFTFIIGAAMMLMQALHIDGRSNAQLERSLRITVPEDLDHVHLFDDLMERYTTSSELIKIKSTAMGSLFKLTWDIRLKDEEREKEFIDALRCRNGNLEISMSKMTEGSREL